MPLPSSGLLPATKTRTLRHWCYAPRLDGPTTSGVLFVIQDRDVSTYALTLKYAALGAPLVVLTPKSGNAYWLGLTPAGAVRGCNCRGYQTQKHCKHADAVNSMLRTGVLIVPAAAPQVPENGTCPTR